MATPSRDRIMRTILAGAAPRISGADPHALDSSYALQKATGISYSYVHRTLHELAQLKLIEFKPRQPIKLLAPVQTYEWWAKNHRHPKRVPLHTPNATWALDFLRQENVEFAITTYHAESVYQGHLFNRRLDIYVPTQELERLKIKMVGSGALLGGSNTRLWADEAGVISESSPRGQVPYPVVPLPQLILDLWLERGSAREAADMLLERAYG